MTFPATRACRLIPQPKPANRDEILTFCYDCAIMYMNSPQKGLRIVSLQSREVNCNELFRVGAHRVILMYSPRTCAVQSTHRERLLQEELELSERTRNFVDVSSFYTCDNYYCYRGIPGFSMILIELIISALVIVALISYFV